MELKTFKKWIYKYYYCKNEKWNLIVFSYPLHRLMSWLIDWVFIGILLAIIFILWDTFNFATFKEFYDSLFAWGIIILYHAIFWILWNWKTIWKNFMWLKVVDKKFTKIKWYQAIWRSLWYLPHAMVANLPYLIMFFTKKNVAINDMVAQTYVVYQDKKIPKFILETENIKD